MFRFTSFRKHQFSKTAVVGIHDVERHLDRVEGEAVFIGHFQHVQMDKRILVAGEADVAQLARFFCFQEHLVGAVFVEDAVRVFEADDFMVLDEIDAVGLEPAKGFVQLPLRFPPGAAVDFGHEEYLVPVSVAERLPHAHFADTTVVVPGVVHEVDAVVHGGMHDADSELFVEHGQSQVPPPDTDGGNLLPVRPSVR